MEPLPSKLPNIQKENSLSDVNKGKKKEPIEEKKVDKIFIDSINNKNDEDNVSIRSIKEQFQATPLEVDLDISFSNFNFKPYEKLTNIEIIDKVRSIEPPQLRAYVMATYINKRGIKITPEDFSIEDTLLMGPHLKYINLDNIGKKWNAREIDEIIKASPNVTVLTLNNVSIQVLPTLRYCESISLINCDELQSVLEQPQCSKSFICFRCDKLIGVPETLLSKEVRFDVCGMLGNLPNLPNVQDLYIAGCHNLLELPPCPSLKYLSLSNCKNLIKFQLNFPNLLQIKLSDIELKELLLTAPSLKEMSITSCNNLMKMSMNVPNIQNLTLHLCSNLREISSSFASLKKLIIFECPNLTKCSEIPSSCKLHNSPPCPAFDNFLHVPPPPTGVTTLTINIPNNENELLDLIERNPNLEKLTITGDGKEKWISFNSLNKLKNLKEICLVNCSNLNFDDLLESCSIPIVVLKGPAARNYSRYQILSAKFKYEAQDVNDEKIFKLKPYAKILKEEHDFFINPYNHGESLSSEDKSNFIKLAGEELKTFMFRESKIEIEELNLSEINPNIEEIYLFGKSDLKYLHSLTKLEKLVTTVSYDKLRKFINSSPYNWEVSYDPLNPTRWSCKRGNLKTMNHPLNQPLPPDLLEANPPVQPDKEYNDAVQRILTHNQVEADRMGPPFKPDEDLTSLVTTYEANDAELEELIQTHHKLERLAIDGSQLTRVPESFKNLQEVCLMNCKNNSVIEMLASANVPKIILKNCFNMQKGSYEALQKFLAFKYQIKKVDDRWELTLHSPSEILKKDHDIDKKMRDQSTKLSLNDYVSTMRMNEKMELAKRAGPELTSFSSISEYSKEMNNEQLETLVNNCQNLEEILLLDTDESVDPTILHNLPFLRTLILTNSNAAKFLKGHENEWKTRLEKNGFIAKSSCVILSREPDL